MIIIVISALMHYFSPKNRLQNKLSQSREIKKNEKTGKFSSFVTVYLKSATDILSQQKNMTHLSAYSGF